eukprot:jgi/Botrbrau1/10376/Bobra.146_2s0014.1
MEPNQLVSSPEEDLDDILDDALEDFKTLCGSKATPTTTVLHERVLIEEIVGEAGPSSSGSQSTKTVGATFDPLHRAAGKPARKPGGPGPARPLAFDPLSRPRGRKSPTPASGPDARTAGSSGTGGGAQGGGVDDAYASIFSGILPSEPATGTPAGLPRGQGPAPGSGAPAGPASGPRDGLAFDPLKKVGGRGAHRGTGGSGTGGHHSVRDPLSAAGPSPPVPPNLHDLANMPEDVAQRLEQLMAELANQDLLGGALGGAGGAPPWSPGGPVPWGTSGPSATLEALAQHSQGPNAPLVDEDLQLLHQLTEQLNKLEGVFRGGAEETAPAGPAQGTGDWAGLGGLGPGTDLTALAETFMQGLLSKEVLYQPMKDIAERYPAWLDANRGLVEEAQYSVYEQQYSLTRTIVAEFERDSHRQDVILNLVQEMQATGAPPQEIMAEVTQGVTFDGDGLPSIPGLSSSGSATDNCCIQ